MEALAAFLPPEELNRVGFRLSERFRPDVPEGAQGWGAKRELRIQSTTCGNGPGLQGAPDRGTMNVKSAALRGMPG